MKQKQRKWQTFFKLRPKSNIGTTDRIIRFVIALFLLAYAAWQLSWIALVAGLFTLYESLASWCVLYQFLGKNSCPIKRK